MVSPLPIYPELIVQAGHAALCSDACVALCPAGIPDRRPSGQSAQAQRHPCPQPNLRALPHVSVLPVLVNPGLVCLAPGLSCR